MCKWGTTREVTVTIPAELSCTGEERLAVKPIDSCIADIVEALEKGGIKMRGSCCGHGKGDGRIDLVDGRAVEITDRDTGSANLLMGNHYRCAACKMPMGSPTMCLPDCPIRAAIAANLKNDYGIDINCPEHGEPRVCEFPQ